MENILIATDGSKTSNKALMEGRRLAECMGAKVTIINVASDLISHPYFTNKEYSAKTKKDLLEFGQKILDEALEIFKGYPGEVSTISKSGDAAKEIIAEAKKGGYDLIIMGSRGLGAISQAMIGSVSHKVLNNVDTQVLIVSKRQDELKS